MQSSFGDIIEGEDNFTGYSPQGQYNREKAITEYNCPSSATTLAGCQAIPNAVWIPSGPQGTQGICHCCLTNGQVYGDPNFPAEPCILCSSGGCSTGCGTPNAFCGSTNISNCVQDDTSLTWSIECTNTTPCGGSCSGSCGINEWIAFETCTPLATSTTPPQYSCQFSIFQWKSIVFYGIIYILLIILFVVLYQIFAPAPKPNQIIYYYYTSAPAPPPPQAIYYSAPTPTS